MKSPIGVQRPRLAALPKFKRSLGDQADRFAREIGIELDDWQRWLLEQLLGQDSDGRWSAPDAGICIGRQNGKNEVLVIRELFGLLVLKERGILHTAHLHKAVNTQFRRVKAVFESTPVLKARLKASNSAVGQQFIELNTGQRIDFATRQGSKTGRSLTLDLVVHDECMYISDVAIAAVMPTLSAQSMHGNIQTIYAGSAPDADEPDHDGLPFSRLRMDALKGSSGVLWAEWSVECANRDQVPAEWLADPEKIAQANPALGTRIAMDWCLQESRRLKRLDYLRERLGITRWPDPSEDAGRVISREVWDAAACRDQAQRIADQKMFALDADVENAWASISVAGHRPDGLLHFALVDRQRKTGWIVERCLELDRENPGALFLIDKQGPLAHLIDELRCVELVEIDTTEYAEACALFVELLNQAQARYPYPQPELSEAINDARKQKMGDRWKWSRRNSSSADISPLVTASLALWGAQTLSAPRGPLLELIG